MKLYKLYEQVLTESLIREELSDDEMNQLKELINSGQGDNIELAFMIASGHGEDVENALFTYWHNSMNETNLTWDELKNLNSLYLNDNNLTSLPESIGKLTKLKALYLGGNKLETLPESIGNLTNLEKLSLRMNKLESLPESIGNLTNLEGLWLYSNPISDEEKVRIKKLLPNTEVYF